MCCSARFRPAAALAALVLSSYLVAPASAADDAPLVFNTSASARTWVAWESALRGMLGRDRSKVDEAWEQVLALEPSPFRIALLAEYAIQRTTLGGAILLLEQDAEAGGLSDSARRVFELLETGREQMNQADDGFYFSQLGRFDIASANFRALLDAGVDPVALLEFTERVPRRREILIRAINNPQVGAAVRDVLAVLDRGEMLVKADPLRVRENVARLAGPPRGFQNAVSALKDSGEFAIPAMVEVLRDPTAADSLRAAVMRALPTMDRPALNPLVMALRMPDDIARRPVIDALAAAGYAQAVPYLKALAMDPNESAAIRAAAASGLTTLSGKGVNVVANENPARAFLALAEDHYAGRDVLAADPRIDVANVWYWRDDVLQNVEVPTPIFNEVMCMRACEEALRHDPALKPAIGLWIAANFRRENQLPPGKRDLTRPEGFPSADFFALSAGAEYCLAALGLAVRDADAGVALRAIDALRRTGGAASLLAAADGKMPLAEALGFSDRLVRIRAALAIAAAKPESSFEGRQNFLPAMAEALTAGTATRAALIVDPLSQSANATAAVLREMGFDAHAHADLFAAAAQARTSLPGVEVVVLASDMDRPNLSAAIKFIRADASLAALPILVVGRTDDEALVVQQLRADQRTRRVPENPSAAQIGKALSEAAQAAGVQPLTPELGVELATEAARALAGLAEAGRSLWDASRAEPALLAALENDNAELRAAAADALAHVPTEKAQEAIARLALDGSAPEPQRIVYFEALAAAGKRHGSKLTRATIDGLIAVVSGGGSEPLREAAGRALGSANLPGPPASEIIRNQYRG